MKFFVFWLKFHLNLFLRVQSTSINLNNGLALDRRQVIILNSADLIQWRMYVALGGDELMFHVPYETSFPWCISDIH